MHSLRTKYLQDLQFNGLQASTLQKIGEYKGKQELFFQQTPETLDLLVKAAIIESSESSNRLEGIVAAEGRVKALVLKSSAPQNRSEQEIAGYRDALALIHESWEYMDFSVNVILQLHSMVYRYLPNEGGRWKMTDNEIIETNADGSKRVRFKAVKAFCTPQAMSDLTTEFKAASQDPHVEPLVAIPLAILDFLCIHPFTDGNGRMARLLTLLLLYRAGYRVGRYISLERIFEKSKETYYETLEKSSQRWHDGKHDPHPWTNYFWGTLLAAYHEFEERVGTIRTGRGSKTDQIRQAVNRRMGLFAISDIEGDCPGISRDMIRNVLRQLRDEKFILRQGSGRGAKWLVSREEPRKNTNGAKK
ncbi:MAG: Fic family protein [Candidatus Ozemobacteraceae bacterium]